MIYNWVLWYGSLWILQHWHWQVNISATGLHCYCSFVLFEINRRVFTDADNGMSVASHVWWKLTTCTVGIGWWLTVIKNVVFGVIVWTWFFMISVLGIHMLSHRSVPLTDLLGWSNVRCTDRHPASCLYSLYIFSALIMADLFLNFSFSYIVCKSIFNFLYHILVT